MQEKDISKVSKRYKNLLHIVFYCIPLSYALLWLWVYSGNVPESWVNQHSFKISGDITLIMCLLGFLATMIKGTIIMYGVWILKQLFGYYENNQFFTMATVACFKKISAALIWWVIAGIVSGPLLSIILTMNNPEGQRAVAITFQSADLTALIIGGVLSVIARVMESGRMLQEESQLTI